MATTDPTPEKPGPNLSLISTQLSWQRSDLSNLRALLAWARTAVSMIGFGFTIYNFSKGFLEDLATAGRTDGARNLALALVIAGALAMVVAYALPAVLIPIGLITLIFILRVISQERKPAIASAGHTALVGRLHGTGKWAGRSPGPRWDRASSSAHVCTPER